MAAVRLLQAEHPDLRVRVVNVTDLMVLSLDSQHPHGLDEAAFEAPCTPDRPVVLNFHGYPAAIQQLLFGRPRPERFRVNGHQEEGTTTTTPFDVHVHNGTSRYHLVQQVFDAVPRLRGRSPAVRDRHTGVLQAHRACIEAHGEDPPEIRDWRW